MAQRLRSRATAAVAAGLAATCIGVAAAPAFADTVRNEEWWLTSLHVTKAWLSSRGTGVTVAVLDTGVDATQPDLAGSVTTGRDFTASGRTAGGPFWGVHGTAVASLIAGHGHGPHHGDGIIGVAPQAKILSVRVTLENKDPLLANPTVVAALPTAIARGIRYAVRHGAQVIDLPLDPAAQAGGTTQGGSPAERSAVEAALAKGVVLVAPSGDNGAGSDTPNFPAAYPGVIAVGAFGQGFVKAPFTNLQSYAALTAAGNGVIAANGPTGYAKLKSTSAASAVVAGIAALIRSQFPTLTPAQVEQALTTSTAFQPQGGRKDGSGFGTADAAAALLAAAKINATPTSPASAGGAANPTPPKAPKVHVTTKSLWQAVRIPVLGLVALLLLGLIILITVRVRQRRALDAQLAPLQAAARASRAQGAAGMTGMGSPGPGYGPPPGGSVAGRVPASSEPAGSGPGSFGLSDADLAGPGAARIGSAGLTPAGSRFASGGMPDSERSVPGSVGRATVSGRPPWEEDGLLAPAPPPTPPAPEPGRTGARFMLPGRGLGSLDTPGGRPGTGGSAGGSPSDSMAPGNPAGGSSGRGRGEGTSSLTLGGWSLGKPSSGGPGRLGARNGVPDEASGTVGKGTTGNDTAGNGTAGHRTAGDGTAGDGTAGNGTAGNGTAGSGRTGTGRTGTGNTGTGNTGTGDTGAGSGAPGARGPLGGFGGTGSNGAAAAARARFGPSPFDNPAFEIPAFDPSASGGSSRDDRAFGPAAGSSPGTSTPGTPTQGSSTPDASTPDSSTPDAPTRGSFTRGAFTPDASTPGSSTPDAPTPDSSTPDAPTRGSFTWGSPTPGAAPPAASAPASPAPGSFTPGAPIPGAPTPWGPALRPSAPGSSTPASSAPGAPAPASSAPPSSAPGAPAPGAPTPWGTAPPAAAKATPPVPPAAPGGSRGSGRHGAARGTPGGASPATETDTDGPGPGRAGDAPAPPMRALGSASRLNAARAPRPSGQPPWEPAEKPSSELPWMDAPSSGQNRMVPPRRVFPVGSEGPSAGAASSGLGPGGGAGHRGQGGPGPGPGAGAGGSGRPPAGSRPADPGPPPMTASGLVRRRPKSQSPFPDLDGPPPGVDQPAGSEDAEGDRPMYSWNPSDTTEAFPVVRPPGDSRPG
jgi:Subtilase family